MFFKRWNKKIPFILMCLVLGQSSFANNVNRFDHPGGFHTQKQIENIRQRIIEKPENRAYKALIDHAENFLSFVPHPMADYNAHYFYGKNKTPSPSKDKLSKDAFAAYTLALAYQLDVSEKRASYADKAVEILNAWATTNRKISGFDGNLTACYCAPPMILAAELLSDYEHWNQQDQNSFKKWISNTLLKSANAIKHKKNNHGCWGLYTSLACHHYLDDVMAFQKDTAILEKQIASLIDKKGEFPAENKRTNSGMWYTYFALCPLTCSAHIATNVTEKNYFNSSTPNGRSLKLALDSLFNYCKNPDSWSYEKPAGLKGFFYNIFTVIP